MIGKKSTTTVPQYRQQRCCPPSCATMLMQTKRSKTIILRRQRPLLPIFLVPLIALLSSMIQIDFVSSFLLMTPITSPPQPPSSSLKAGTTKRKNQVRYHFGNVHRIRSSSSALAFSSTSESSSSSNDNSQESLSSSCPFSKSFPRYRIDLTRFKSTGSGAGAASSDKIGGGKDNEKLGGWFPKVVNPFKDMSNSFQRSQFEKEYSSSSDTKVLWQSNLDGISALAYLWNQAANTLSSNESSSDVVVVVALPDSSFQLVKNWVEIMEWMSTIDHPLMTNTMRQPTTTISASLVYEDAAKVPAVKIQKLVSLSSSYPGDAPTTKVDIENNKKYDIDLQIERTKSWVKRILVKEGICPFTKSVTKSGQGLSEFGVPIGSIAYSGSFATSSIQLMADIWSEMDKMIQAGPSGSDGVSSILMSAPAFDDDFDFWAGPIFAMLESGVMAAQAESQLGVVCFHPLYKTPDGKSWPGFGHMHSVPRLTKWYKEYYEENDQEEPPKDLSTQDIAAGGAWQRRTPHATINVLRADQLAAAEGRRQSGSMYTENINKLVCQIGLDKLTQDLQDEQQLGL